MNNARPKAASSTVHWLLTIAGTAGIVALFLPFAYDISPVEAAPDEGLWRLAIPLFLAVPAVAASVRWIVLGSLSMPERVVAYVVSVSMVCVTLLVIWPELFNAGEDFELAEWPTTVAPLAILTLGVFALVRNWRNGASPHFCPVIAIQVAYLAHAALLLAGFYDELNLGAWFVLTAVLAYALQIILVSVQPGKKAQDRAS